MHSTQAQPAKRLLTAPIQLAWIWLQIQYHAFIVRGDLRYMQQLADGGILDGVTLQAFRREIARRECLVLALDADARALRAQEQRA